MNSKLIALVSATLCLMVIYPNVANACCYHSTQCLGTCLVGNCVPIPTSLIPVGGTPDPWGWYRGPSNCGICWESGVPLGTCGPKLCEGSC
jgi:hypothetical protein